MYKLLTLSFMALAFSTSESAAFSVQSLNDAFSYNNIARDYVHPAPAKPEKSNTAPIIVDDTPIDYQTIAEKLLSKNGPQKLYINFCKTTAQNVQGKIKQTFFVILPEEEGTKWVMDTKCADIIDSQKDKHRRIWKLQLKKGGKENVFIDNIDTKNQTVKQSRILRLWVQE